MIRRSTRAPSVGIWLVLLDQPMPLSRVRLSVHRRPIKGALHERNFDAAGPFA
jgi:hypothetical protein